jgi:hypothetical protein
MVPHVRESAMRADGTSSVWNASAGKRLGPRHGREAILEAVAQSTAIGISAEARGLLTVMLRERITFTPIASSDGPMYELRIPMAAVCGFGSKSTILTSCSRSSPREAF